MEAIKNAYNESFEQVVESLKTTLTKGLEQSEAERRLTENGYNEFVKKKTKSLFIKFIEQFKSFMIIVLLVAAFISGVVGFINGEGFTDAIIILLIVIINAVIGVMQESKAEQSLSALEKMSAPQCKVIRDGEVRTIPSKGLVVGDLVILETGDAVPADIRLTQAINLKIQEAALTGESIPTEKHIKSIDEENIPLGDQNNVAFSSCVVTYGRGQGIVVATGMQTEVGKIASMIQSVSDTQTPLQQKLDKLGKFLGITALIICALLFFVGIAYGKNILEMFMTAVSLAAAAIPEGLPAVSTIVLAVGVQRLVKKNAIVRTLPSVETLGSTTVICSDKTGTLTQNKMTVVKLFFNDKMFTTDDILKDSNNSANKLLTIAILANDTKLSVSGNSYQTTGDPTETSLIDLGLKFNINKNDLDANFERIAEFPFDSERKLMSTVNKVEDHYEVYTKGGLDELLSCCSHILIDGIVRQLNESDKESIRKANLHLAENALRVLSMGFKKISHIPTDKEISKIEQGLCFVGLVGMIDPPRPEVKEAVLKCRAAGIKPVMITGDHKITAIAIAQSLGIMQPRDEVRTGAEIEKLTDSDLIKHVEKISVYARVSPEHKVRIVKAFQYQNNIVAMTGDGVNDAPALKLADIGCAMGITGTDVAKGAADIVLVDDNFSTIVEAVQEGRRIYDNILKAIQFLLSTNIGEIVVLFVAIMANWITPLLPIHILWINLVTDSLPALALSVDPADPDIMQRKPIDANKGIMNKGFTLRILLQGVMIGVLSLVAFRIGLKESDEVARTMTFAVLAFTQITHVFNVRSAKYSAFRGMFNNKFLIGAIICVIALMLIVIEIPMLHDIFHLAPLSNAQWVWVIVLSIAPLFIVELVKIGIRMFKK